jgi:hypothetical protein
MIVMLCILGTGCLDWTLAEDTVTGALTVHLQRIQCRVPLLNTYRGHSAGFLDWALTEDTVLGALIEHLQRTQCWVPWLNSYRGHSAGCLDWTLTEDTVLGALIEHSQRTQCRVPWLNTYRRHSAGCLDWTLTEDTVFIFAYGRVFVFEPRRLDLDEWDIRGLYCRLKRTFVKTAVANSSSSDRTSEILFTPNLGSTTKSFWTNFISIYVDAM